MKFAIRQLRQFLCAPARSASRQCGRSRPGLRRRPSKPVTLYPAQIFGVADQIGTLETGKIANIIVTNGDPLEVTTDVRYLFIKGQLTSTDNKHKRCTRSISIVRNLETELPLGWRLGTRSSRIIATFQGELRFSLWGTMRTRSSIAFALLIAAFCFAPALLAQDANKVIDQYVKAVGGSGKLSKVLSISIVGTLIRESDGKTGSFTLDSKTPNRYYLEIITAELPEIIAYNGKSAWHLRPDGEAVTLLGQDSKEVEAAALLNSIHLLKPKKYKIGAAVVNSTKVRGREAVTIEVTMPTGVKRQFSFDSNTHLLLRESGTTGGISQEILFDDYRPEGGIQIAHKLQLQRGNENYQIAVNRVEINQTIGERVFDFPKKSQVKLPDLKTLFAQIDANQKRVDKLKENYTGRNSSEETEMDGSGKVTKVNREEHTFFYLNGEEVSTLVAKDGKPLSASDQEKENEKTRKRIEEIQKDQAKKDEKKEKESESGKTEGKDDDDPGIECFCELRNL